MESSENFFYDVPIVNLDDVEIVNSIKSPGILTTKTTEPKANNGCIIELENSKEYHPNHNSNVHTFNEVNKKNIQSTDQIEKCLDEPTTIIIDEDSEKDNDCTIVDVIDSHETQSKSTSNHENISNYDKILKENKLLIDIIEKCLDIEDSADMLRIINRTLIPTYFDADETLKKSNMFEKILSLVIIKLDTEPDRKFSHLKGLCELIKSCKKKKRASLITLKSNLNGKFSTNKTTYSAHNNMPFRKKRKVDVIDLDDDDDDDDVIIDCNSDTDIQINNVSDQIIENMSSPVQVINDYETHIEINDSESDSDVQLNEQIEKNDDNDVILIDESDKSNKRTRTGSINNNVMNKSMAVNNLLYFERKKQRISLNNNEATKIDICNGDGEIQNSNNVLYQSKPVTREILRPQNDIKEHIAKLEKEIAYYNKCVKNLEEKEVACDYTDSPYIQSDIYKAKIVSLYKDLCKLTGTESVKRHKVRLTVAPGHREGPVKCLEGFINDNIDEKGDPPFPDIHDVKRCVYIANKVYKMGWNKTQIDAEARALFIHYGRTVQKRRQKREWRHLLSYVKEEAPDPADCDPVLQARLQENARVAKINENKLFDRFVEMEDSRLLDPGLSMTYQYESEEDSDHDSTSPMDDVSNNDTAISDANNDSVSRVTMNSCIESSDGNITDSSILYNPSTVPIQEMVASENAMHDSVAVNQNADSNNTTVIEQNLEINGNEDLSCNVNRNDDRETNEIDIKPNSEEISIIRNTEVTSNVAVQNNEMTSNWDECGTSKVKDKTNIVENSECFNKSACESNVTCEGNSDAGSTQTLLNEMKREPLDIPYLLAQLGDNYTATIIDIEDPFLVIEISDSSESEDEDMQTDTPRGLSIDSTAPWLSW